MTSRHKLIGLLTAVQLEVIKELFSLYKQCGDARFWKPRDIGAYRSSHHALTLKRLACQGLVDSKELPSTSMAKKYAYRISMQGVAVWELVIDVVMTPLMTLPGGRGAQQDLRELARLAQ
jgi:hypothetical protein